MSAGDPGTATVAVASGPRPQARSGWLLLALVLVAGGALRLWYLPTADRLSAESPGIENLESRLAGGAMSDYSAPALSWAPQRLVVGLADRLHDGDPGTAFHVLTAKGGLTRRGLEVARCLSVLYGLAGLALLFPIARRLHSTGVALLAVLILCFSPWHIQASVSFAPQVLILALSLLALWLGLRALDRPSPVRMALVGVALGVAAGAGVSGALIAPPVLVAMVFGGRRALRRGLLALAITLPLAVLVWWMLVPPLDRFAAALELEQASQARMAVREVSSRFTVAVYGVLHPLRESVHGRLLGSLALLGALGQAFRCLFLINAGPARAHRLMVLAAAPVFIVGYAWGTPLYSATGFVPLLAFSSLYAALMLGILWDAVVGWQPRLARPRAAAVAAAVAAALVVPTGWRFVHSRAVGTTLDGALDWLGNGFSPAAGPRLVLVEEAALDGSSPMKLARGFGLGLVPRLAAVGEKRLARADGEIFLRRELEGAEGAFYRGRGRVDARRKLIEGDALWTRGPDLVAVRHTFGGGPAERVVLPVGVRRKQRVATVPAVAGEEALLSLVLRLPPTVEAAPSAPRARIGGLEIELAPAGRSDGQPVFVSERLPTAAKPRSLVIDPPPWMSARRGELTAAIYLWR